MICDKEDKNDVVMLAKKMEDKLKTNFLELEAQEFSVFSAKVSNNNSYYCSIHVFLFLFQLCV